MSKNNSSNNSGSTTTGLGFCGALTIVFIVLKLCHVISWSWIWVLAPTWIPIVLTIIICIIAGVLVVRNEKWQKEADEKNE